MPAILTSVDACKTRLKIDSDDDDDNLEGLVEAASARIVLHLGAQADDLLDLDTNGDMASGFEVPALIEAATIMLVGYLYRNPDGDPDKDFGEGMLPLTVKTLLYPLRDPALA